MSLCIVQSRGFLGGVCLETLQSSTSLLGRAENIFYDARKSFTFWGVHPSAGRGGGLAVPRPPPQLIKRAQNGKKWTEIVYKRVNFSKFSSGLVALHTTTFKISPPPF